MRLPDNPRAVITGGGNGLGRALALRLAPRRARLVVADIDLPAAEETCRLVTEAGGEAIAVRCDVGALADVEALAATADARFGGTDLLVNNAGVAAGGFVGEFPIEDWEWILRVNLWGAIHGCHVFVPRMRAQKRGFILNVASMAGFACLPEMAPYNVTKAGVIALSETLHVELASSKIAVTCLCPTFFQSRIMESFRGADRQRALANRFFRASSVTSDDVAAAALRGLEKGRLFVIPQRDGALVWRAKRILPDLYYSMLRLNQRRDWFQSRGHGERV